MTQNRGRYESAVDRQIREAQERGAFDDLPGAGKPLPGLDDGHPIRAPAPASYYRDRL